MKKLSYLIVLILILGLALTGCLLSNVGQVPETKQGSKIITEIGDLVAGQNEVVGNVKAWYADGKLCIRYNITDPCWLLLETHWEVSIEGKPSFPVTKKGNPKIGDFSYGDDTLGTFVEGNPEDDPPTENSYTGGVDFYEECIPVNKISGVEYGDDICIAAHASMVNKCEIREETAWAFGTPFDGNSWATYFCLKKTIEVWPESGTTTVAFEDLPFRRSLDWDYNDWVADINTVATFWGKDLESIDFTITPEARGAGFEHVFHLSIPAYTFGSDGTYTYTLTFCDVNGMPIEDHTKTGKFETSKDNDFTVIPSTWEALPPFLPTPPYPYPPHTGIPIHTNTRESEEYIQPQRTATLSIVFDELVPFALNTYSPENVHGEGLFFDPYLYVFNTKNEINQGDPRMLTVPLDWKWPEEKKNIWKVYTDVGEVASPPPPPPPQPPPTDPTDPDQLPVFGPNWWLTYNNLVYGE